MAWGGRRKEEKVTPQPLTASVWLTFAQAGINPVVCFLFNRELRDCFRAQFPCCQSPQATQATLPCDLKGIGL